MTVPEPHPGLDSDEAEAVRRHRPAIYQWLNGNGPASHVLVLPVRCPYGLGRLFLEQQRLCAPAPWAGRPYRYMWPVAMVDGVVVAHGEPYRWFDPTFPYAGRG